MPKRQPIYHADHIEIPLTKGYSAIVDLDCPAWILEQNWQVALQKGRPTAQRTVGPRADRKVSLMHREIAGLSRGDGLEVDHIDRNPLNNRRSNLRICTGVQNKANVAANAGSRSRHRGVASTPSGRWRARYRDVYIGTFDTEEEAAIAWNRWVTNEREHDFVRLNEVRDD